MLARRLLSLWLLLSVLMTPAWAQQANSASTNTPGRTGAVVTRKPEFHSDFRRFPKDFWADLGEFFSRQSILPAVVGLGAAAAVNPKDDEVARYFLRQDRFPDAGRVGDVLGNGVFIAGVAGGLFVTSRLTDNQEFREVSYSVAQAVALQAAFLYPLKIASGRERPNRSDSRSFPSGHASNTFAVASVLDHYYGAKVGIPLYLASAFVSVSRLEANKHFMSDVIAGATLGYLAGKAVTRNADRQHFAIAPVLSPDGKDRGVTVQYHWGE